MPAIFVDANIPIYASGSEHALKRPCSEVILLAARHDDLVTSAEVLQEVLHYCRSRREWPASLQVFEAFAELMSGRVEPVQASDIEQAAQLVQKDASLSARDLVHAAVMQRLKITRIISTDRDFDRVPGLERLDPTEMTAWHDSIGGS